MLGGAYLLARFIERDTDEARRWFDAYPYMNSTGTDALRPELDAFDVNIVHDEMMSELEGVWEYTSLDSIASPQNTAFRESEVGDRIAIRDSGMVLLVSDTSYADYGFLGLRETTDGRLELYVLPVGPSLVFLDEQLTRIVVEERDSNRIVGTVLDRWVDSRPILSFEWVRVEPEASANVAE